MNEISQWKFSIQCQLLKFLFFTYTKSIFVDFCRPETRFLLIYWQALYGPIRFLSATYSSNKSGKNAYDKSYKQSLPKEKIIKSQSYVLNIMHTFFLSVVKHFFEVWQSQQVLFFTYTKLIFVDNCRDV